MLYRFIGKVIAVAVPSPKNNPDDVKSGQEPDSVGEIQRLWVESFHFANAINSLWKFSNGLVPYLG